MGDSKKNDVRHKVAHYITIAILAFAILGFISAIKVIIGLMIRS